MRNLFGGMGLVVLSTLLPVAAPLRAQTANAEKKAIVLPVYDASKEVTLEGVVESLDTTPAPGKLVGAHLIFATAHGTVDAHLGSFALKGSNPVSLIPGEHVRVTGIMSTKQENQIFLARTIQVNDRTYQIRNEHGALLMPSAGRGSFATRSNGGAR